MKIKIASKTKLVKAIAFIISLTIACTRDYGDLHLKGLTLFFQYGIGLLWIGFAGLKILSHKGIARTIEEKDTFWFLKMYLLPQIIFFGYSIIIMMFGISKWEYLGTNLTSFIPIILAIIAFYFFKEKAFKYVCISIGLSWTLSTMFALLQHGPFIIRQAIIQGFIDSYYISASLSRANYFEIHDIVLAVGYFVVFYFYSKIDKNKEEKSWSRLYLIFFLLIALMGIKRVGILGIIIALLFRILIKRWGKKRLKVCIISGWVAFFLCFFFIYILSSGDWIFKILRDYGINPAGRNRYYKTILDLSVFSPSWLGLGRGAVAKILNNEMIYLGVGGVHSDLIKIYVENGFILYAWWLWYFLIHNTKKYAKRFNINAAVVYFGITIYMFVLYTTDNTDVYFACQLLCVTLPITYASGQRYNVVDNRVENRNRHITQQIYRGINGSVNQEYTGGKI